MLDRRRFKLAVQDYDNTIPFPQREVWLRAEDGLQLKLEGKLDAPNRNGKARSNSHSEQKIDSQPRNAPDDNDGAEAPKSVPDSDGDGEDL